jgi:hypothetical protein
MGDDDRQHRLIQVSHRAADIKTKPPPAVLRSLDIIIPLLWWVIKQM